MIEKTWEAISEAGDDLIAEIIIFMDNLWVLLMAEVKSPRHLDKYMLGFMMFVAMYVLASCGKSSF